MPDPNFTFGSPDYTQSTNPQRPAAPPPTVLPSTVNPGGFGDNGMSDWSPSLRLGSWQGPLGTTSPPGVTQTSTPYTTPGQAPAVAGGYQPASGLPGVTAAPGQPNGEMSRSFTPHTGTPGAISSRDSIDLGGFTMNDIRAMQADPSKAIGTPFEKYLVGGSKSPGSGAPLSFNMGAFHNANPGLQKEIHAALQAGWDANKTPRTFDPSQARGMQGANFVKDNPGTMHAANAAQGPQGPNTRVQPNYQPPGSIAVDFGGPMNGPMLMPPNPNPQPGGGGPIAGMTMYDPGPQQQLAAMQLAAMQQQRGMPSGVQSPGVDNMSVGPGFGGPAQTGGQSLFTGLKGIATNPGGPVFGARV
jgi:hypothetical protein